MIYVMSDIHGNRTRFNSIMKQIHLTGKDHLYVLGDCVDRFPDGTTIFTGLIRKPNVTMLLGNHELMMLKALTLTDPEDRYIRHWYRNGGDLTHRRFSHCSHAYREAFLEQIRDLPLNAEVRCNGVDYLLVHGAPVGFSTARNDVVMDAVWTRLTADDIMPEGKVVIFGHTPTCHYQDGSPQRIFHGNRMIGIDCEAGEPDGRLACLRLDDMKEFYSEG